MDINLFSNGVCIQWATVQVEKSTTNQLYQYPITCSVYCIVTTGMTANTNLPSDVSNVVYATSSTSQTSTQARLISTSYSSSYRKVRIIIIGYSDAD